MIADIISHLMNRFIGVFTSKQASVSTEASESPKQFQIGGTNNHQYQQPVAAIPASCPSPKPQKIYHREFGCNITDLRSQFYRRADDFYYRKNDWLVTDLVLIDMLYILFPGEDDYSTEPEEITEMVSEAEGDDSPEPCYTPETTYSNSAGSSSSSSSDYSGGSSSSSSSDSGGDSDN